MAPLGAWGGRCRRGAHPLLPQGEAQYGLTTVIASLLQLTTVT